MKSEYGIFSFFSRRPLSSSSSSGEWGNVRVESEQIWCAFSFSGFWRSVVALARCRLHTYNSKLINSIVIKCVIWVRGDVKYSSQLQQQPPCIRWRIENLVANEAAEAANKIIKFGNLFWTSKVRTKLVFLQKLRRCRNRAVRVTFRCRRREHIGMKSAHCLRHFRDMHRTDLQWRVISAWIGNKINKWF